MWNGGQGTIPWDEAKREGAGLIGGVGVWGWRWAAQVRGRFQRWFWERLCEVVWERTLAMAAFTLQVPRAYLRRGGNLSSALRFAILARHEAAAERYGSMGST